MSRHTNERDRSRSQSFSLTAVEIYILEYAATQIGCRVKAYRQAIKSLGSSLGIKPVKSNGENSDDFQAWLKQKGWE